MRTIARGNAKRIVAAMKMNARSSRGHAILTLYVEEVGMLGAVKTSKLNLVDLAGSRLMKRRRLKMAMAMAMAMMMVLVMHQEIYLDA